MGVIEKISLSLSTKLGNRLNKNQEEIAVLNYGLFMIMHTFIGIIFTTLVGLLTGMVIEILLISITTSLFKRYTGGAHASTPERCLIIGTVLSLTLSILCRYIVSIIDINGIVFIQIAIIAFSYYTIYYKCPVPSKNKPLKNEKTRKKLRKKAFILLNSYFILNVILYLLYCTINLSIIKTIMVSFLLGLLLQIVVLTDTGIKFINLLDKMFNIFN